MLCKFKIFYELTSKNGEKELLWHRGVKSTAASVLKESFVGRSFRKGSFERLLHGSFDTKYFFRRIHPIMAFHSAPLS